MPTSSSSSSSSSSSGSSSSSSSSSFDPSTFSSASSLASGQRFEFTKEQEGIIGALARDMLWVAIPLQIVGVLYGVGLIVYVVRTFQDPHFIFQAMLIGLAMLFYLAMGIWTSRSSQAFGDIVRTRGHDIEHLMDALENLGNMYRLLSTIVKVYLVLVVIAVLLALIAALVVSSS